MWGGEAENDGFNRLVLQVGLNWRQVVVLRAYCKYLLQLGIPFSQAYMEETLARNPGLARLAAELFDASGRTGAWPCTSTRFGWPTKPWGKPRGSCDWRRRLKGSTTKWSRMARLSSWWASGIQRVPR